MGKGIERKQNRINLENTKQSNTTFIKKIEISYKNFGLTRIFITDPYKCDTVTVFLE
jgi:hypothetical protein